MSLGTSRAIFALLFGLGALLTPYKTRGAKAACCDVSGNLKVAWNVVLHSQLPINPGCSWDPPYGTGAVAFISQDRIAAGIHFDCLDQASPPARLRTRDLIALVNARTGQLVDEVVLENVSTNRNWAANLRIIPTHDGQFLVSTGSLLKLYSPELKELRSRLFAPGPSTGDYWIVHVIDHGGSALVKHWTQSSSQDYWISSDTLQDTAVEDVPSDELWWSAANSSTLYFVPTKGQKDSSGELLVLARTRGSQERRVLCSDCAGIPLGVLSDGVIVLGTGNKGSVTLVNAKGKILHKEEYGKPGDYVRDIATAPGSPLFAFAVGEAEANDGGSYRDVVVFDEASMKTVARARIHQKPQLESGRISGATIPALKVAISPGGNDLALLSGRVLKLFHLSH